MQHPMQKVMPMKKTVLVFLNLCLYSMSILAQQHPAQSPVLINSAFFIASTPINFSDIEQKPVQAFDSIPSEGISFGFNPHTIWLRITLENVSQQPQQGFLDLGTPRLAYANLYQFDTTKKQWTSSQTGLAVPVPVEQRAVAYRRVVFPVLLQALEKRVVYLSISSRLVMTVQMQWWQTADFLQQQAQDERRDLLLFGATLGFAIFGLLQALVARDILLALNGFRCLLAVCYISILLGYASFYSNSPTPEMFLPWANVCSVCYLIIQLLLALIFLPSELYPRWIRYFLSVVVGIAAIIAIGVGVCVPNTAAILLKILSPLGLFVQLPLLYACFICARRGFYPAWWLLCGFSIAVFGFYRRLGEAMGQIPPSAIVEPMILLNAFISALFVYLGTASRVDKLRSEREQALQAHLLLQRETEARLEQNVKQRTVELEIALTTADRANQAKTLFLAKISHELRSPLHTILSYTQLIGREKNLGYLTTVIDAGKHLLSLIDDLLAYVKNSDEALHIKLQPCYLGGLIKQLQAHGTTLAAQNNNQFCLSVAKDLPACVEIDSRRVLQIGLVLLSNAAHYTQNGKIHLRLCRYDEQLQLQVEDNGAGMDEADLQRIFQPFERLFNSHHRAGLGLGLPIALQLAQAMQGQLSVQSTLSVGSIFTLHLPLIDVDPAAIKPFPAQHQVIGYTGKLRRILVVDDTPDHLQFMREFLEALGFEVFTANNAATLLQQAQTSAMCDLVLLDFHLGDVTAEQLLPQLRLVAGWQKIPVILISASSPASNADVAAILSKPSSDEQILNALARLLNLEWIYQTEAAEHLNMVAYQSEQDWQNALNTGDLLTIEAYIQQLANSDADLAQQARQYLECYDFAAMGEHILPRLP